jgi:hypothetical protein
MNSPNIYGRNLLTVTKAEISRYNILNIMC